VPAFNLNHDNKDSNEDIIENQLESSDVHLGKYFFIFPTIKLLFLFQF